MAAADVIIIGRADVVVNDRVIFRCGAYLWYLIHQQLTIWYINNWLFDTSTIDYLIHQQLTIWWCAAHYYFVCCWCVIIIGHTNVVVNDRIIFRCGAYLWYLIHQQLTIWWCAAHYYFVCCWCVIIIGHAGSSLRRRMPSGAQRRCSCERLNYIKWGALIFTQLKTHHDQKIELYNINWSQ